MSPEQTRITRLEAVLGNLMKAYAACNGEDHQAYIDAEAILSTAAQKSEPFAWLAKHKRDKTFWPSEPNQKGDENWHDAVPVYTDPPAPTHKNLHAVAVSLSTMVYEWVDTGLKGGTDWKSGLALIIEKRLRRFPSLSSQEQDTATLDERMKAAGMYTAAEMMGVTPLTKWMSNPAIDTVEAFSEWLDRKTAEYYRMKAAYELGDKSEKDELYEWVLAHSGVFSTIRDQFRVVKTTLPQATPEGWKLVPKEPLPAQLETAAFNLSAEYGPEFVLSNQPFARAVYDELVAAAPAPTQGIPK